MVTQVHGGFLDHFLPVQNLFLNLLMKYYTHKMTKKKKKKKDKLSRQPFSPPSNCWLDVSVGNFDPTRLNLRIWPAIYMGQPWVGWTWPAIKTSRFRVNPLYSHNLSNPFKWVDLGFPACHKPFKPFANLIFWYLK